LLLFFLLFFILVFLLVCFFFLVLAFLFFLCPCPCPCPCLRPCLRLSLSLSLSLSRQSCERGMRRHDPKGNHDALRQRESHALWEGRLVQGRTQPPREPVESVWLQ
jgi:hypothetical protein